MSVQTNGSGWSSVSHLKIGHVIQIEGKVVAYGSGDSVRVLKLNDPVYLNERIKTFGNSMVAIQGVHNKYIDLGYDSEMLLDATVAGLPQGQQKATPSEETLAAIQAAILEGKDPTEILEETAAGDASSTSASSGEDEGNGFITVAMTLQKKLPDSGYETIGLGYGFPEGMAFETPIQQISVNPDVNLVNEANAISENGSLPLGAGFESISISGNIFENDDLGNIDSAQLSALSFNGLRAEKVGDFFVINSPDGVWSLSVHATTGDYTFTLLQPFSHSAPGIDSANLVFNYTISDNFGNSASTSLTITIVDDIPKILGVSNGFVDEDNLLSSSQVSISVGQISYEFGADGPGSFIFDPTQGLPSLSSGGQAISYSVSSDGTLLTASTSSADIFTLNLDPVTGQYTFTLLGPIDHPIANSEDNIVLNFNVMVIDGDGDVASTAFTITINDDVPTASATAEACIEEREISTRDEAQLPPSVSGQINASFGADGPGSISLSNTVQATNENGSPAGGLTSNGIPVFISVSSDGTLLTGTQGENGPVVFTLSIDPVNGTYLFTLLGSIDHSGQGNDHLELTFSFAVTDNDNDTANAEITICIIDDAPVLMDDIGPDGGIVYESALPNGSGGNSAIFTGNVLANDNLGGDGGTIINVNGQTAINGVITVVTAAGTLLVYTTDAAAINAGFAAAGDYLYTLQNPTIDGIGPEIDAFTYTVQDNDGDQASASLEITIIDDLPTANDDVGGPVDESALPDGTGGGTTMATGNLLVNDVKGADGAVISSVEGQNAVNGVITVVTAAGTLVVYTTDAAAINAGFAAAGDYQYTLMNGTSQSQEQFTYILTDGDGDTDPATLTISITDDEPDLTDDIGPDGGVVHESAIPVIGSGGGTQTFTGNVLANDNLGGDGGTIINVNGQMAVNGVITVVTAAGTLVVYTTDAAAINAGFAAAGDYLYTLQNPTFDGAGPEIDSFTYVVQDGDGDQASASLEITIIDDLPTANDDVGGPVDESALPDGTGGGTTMATGNLLVNDVKGADGAVISSVEGQNAVNGVITVVTAAGTLVVYTTDAAAINAGFAAAGDYQYTLMNGTSQSQEQFTYILTDGDGDTDPATLTISITDDEPDLTDDIGPDGGVVHESAIPVIGSGGGTQTFTGNVLANDNLGGDGGTIINVNGQTAINGVITVVTAAGTLLVYTTDAAAINAGFAAAGDYLYTLQNPTIDGIGPEIDAFTYTVQDNDGDQASASLEITIIDDLPTANDDVGGPVDESALPDGTGGGTTMATGNLLVNDVKGADGAVISSVEGQNAVNGVITVVTAAGTLVVYTTDAAAINAGFAAAGDYQYTLMNGTSQSQEQFTYILTDGDGDTDPATLIISITDDEPDLTDDIGPDGGVVHESAIPVIGSGGGTQTFAGNVLANDNLGGDGGVIINVNGQMAVNGVITVVTAAGTLVLYTTDAAAINAGFAAAGDYLYTLQNPTIDGIGPEIDAFTYTVQDNDGDQASASLEITIIDDLPTANDDVGGPVDESALPDGTGGGTTMATGNLLVNDVKGADGASITSVEGQLPNVNGVITVNSPDGVLTVFTQDFNGHLAGDYEFVLNAAANHPSDSPIVFNYTLTDGDGDSDPATLTININDDVPIAEDNFVCVDEPIPPIYNLTFIFDVSTSMNAIVNPGESRLDLSKAAFIDLAEQYFQISGNVDITIVVFAGGALNLGTFDNFADVQAAINGITDANGYPFPDGTNYNAGLTVAQAAINAQLPGLQPGTQSIVYFGSDGMLNQGGAVNAGWETFINNNGLTSIAVGIGADIPPNDPNLAAVAFPGNPIIAADENDLSAILIGTITPSVEGNVLTDPEDPPISFDVDQFGADGLDQIVSLLVDGVLYTYNATTDEITNNSNPNVVNGSSLTVDTLLGGTLIFDFSNGDYKYFAPQVAQDATETFTYTISDNDGDLSNADLVICIQNNDAPIANPDVNQVTEDSPPNPVIGNVLVNDTDPEGQILFVSNINGNNTGIVNGLYGTLTWNSDGSYSYLLNNANPSVDGLDSGETLLDVFNYTATDGGENASSTLTITIFGVNDPPVAIDDVNSVMEDTPPNPVFGNVLANDTDVDGDVLTVTTPGMYVGLYGTLTLNADGSYSYLLNNANPTVNALDTGETLHDLFNYTMTDGDAFDSAVLNITINGKNDPPVAIDDVNSVTEDTAPNPVTGNVLANDTDVDGDVLSVTTTGVFVGLYGTLTLNANGSYSYLLNNANPAVDALNNGDTLQDVFNYTNTDGTATDSAQLTITINGKNDPPVANDDVNSVTEDTPPNPVMGNVLANDTDVDGGPLFVSDPGVYIGLYGTLTLNADGSYSYLLDNSNPAVDALNTGDQLFDIFSYTASDGTATDQANLTITINGTNIPPLAFPDVDSIVEGSGLAETGNLLTNDNDPDASPAPLSVLSVEGNNVPGIVVGTYGTLTWNSDGSYSYAVNPGGLDHSNGQTYQDVFNYTNSDGDDTATSTLTIDILDAGPTAIDNVVFVEEPNKPDYNVVFTLDISTSMNAVVPLPGGGTSTRLELAKDALQNLAEKFFQVGNNVQITLIIFAGGALNLGTFTSLAALDTAIENVGDANDYPSIINNTNYNSGLTLTQSALTSQLVGQDPDVNNIVYFLSDGIRNAGGAVDPAWQTFINANDIESIAVGIGADIPASDPDLIAVDSGGNPIVVADENELSEALAGTVPNVVNGNVITDPENPDNGQFDVDDFGPDGAGYVQSIQVDGVTYTYDPDTDTISNGVDFFAGSVISLDLASGGDLTFNFLTGDYGYDTPAIVNQDFAEVIPYTIVDADGSISSADLIINVTDIPPERALEIQMITNTNSNNQLVLVTFTSLTDPTKTVTALIQTDQQGQEGNFVFDAEFIINPTHDYLVTLEWIAGPNVIITDLSIEGVVIVDQGNFKIGDGTGGSTHAISAIISPDDGLLLQGPTESTDGTGGGNTLTATQVNEPDYLFGDGGTDTLNGSAEPDVLNGGTGNDILNGGAGNDVLFWHTGDQAHGGDGDDVLIVDNQGGVSSVTLDLTTLNSSQISNIEVINLQGTGDWIDNSDDPILSGRGDNTLTLNAADVIEHTDSDNLLTVLGDSTDTVNLDLSGASNVSSSSVGGFTTYNFEVAAQMASISIDNQITQNVIM